MTQQHYEQVIGRLVLVQYYIDGLVQDCSNSIANALELLQSCAKPLILPPSEVLIDLRNRRYNHGGNFIGLKPNTCPYHRSSLFHVVEGSFWVWARPMKWHYVNVISNWLSPCPEWSLWYCFASTGVYINWLVWARCLTQCSYNGEMFVSHKSTKMFNSACYFWNLFH